MWEREITLTISGRREFLVQAKSPFIKKLPLLSFLVAKALVSDNLDSYDPEAKCPHNEIMYNVKLMGGLKAGKFTDIGKVKSIKTCIR